MTFVPRHNPIQNMKSFRLGLNTLQTPEELDDAEMADCENWTVEDDTVALAPGYSSWDDDSLAGPYWGGVQFSKLDGSWVDVRQRQGTLEYATNGDSLWTTCTLPTTGSPATAITLTQKACTFAILNNILLWANGTEDIMSTTDGITWTARPSLPDAAVVINNGANRMLFLNQTASKYRLDWSELNDPLTVDASSFQLIDPNSNGPLLGAGLAPDGTNILFKEQGVYAVSSYVTDGIIDINFIGHCTFACHQTVATTENSIMFAGWTNIYEIIGGQIRTVFGKIYEAGRNDALKTNLYCGGYYNGKYHMSMPDADVSQDYNAQEYIVHRKLSRNDAIQPYVITRNRRYFGMYFIEDGVFDYGRDITLFVGDSRPSTSGSPAVSNHIFAWINDYKDLTSSDFVLESGLAGEAQDAFFVTKYFTGDIPFYVKRFKKLFSHFKVTQDLTVTISYRFLPYGSWTDVVNTFQAGSLDMEYDTGETGTFSEGYSFSADTIGAIFTDIENTEKPRGIQFKVSCSSIEDIVLYSMALQYRVKTKFK